MRNPGNACRNSVQEVVEKVNVNFEGSREEFWAFVGWRIKAKNRVIASLKSVEGVSVTSTKAKVDYQHLGRVSVDSDFDDDWKREVKSKVEACGRMLESCEDSFLDKELEKAKIANCLSKLKNNKTGGSDGLVGELLKYGGSGILPYLKRQQLKITALTS